MIKLIACDMDGTLLDSNKELPRDFMRVVLALREKGVWFAVASGRQYAALRRDMPQLVPYILFIAENGALIMQNDRILHVNPIQPDDLPGILRAAQGLEGVYAVICGAREAKISRYADPVFLEDTKRYYPSAIFVENQFDYCGDTDVCKIAFYDKGDAQTHELPAIAAKTPAPYKVILSGEHWVDIMKPGVDKGKAMQALQQLLGITPDECMAFGDYLNDRELLAAVTESYCMANGHPELKAQAKYIAPGNDEDGVMRVIRERFDIA